MCELFKWSIHKVYGLNIDDYLTEKFNQLDDLGFVTIQQKKQYDALINLVIYDTPLHTIKGYGDVHYDTYEEFVSNVDVEFVNSRYGKRTPVIFNVSIFRYLTDRSETSFDFNTFKSYKYILIYRLIMNIVHMNQLVSAQYRGDEQTALVNRILHEEAEGVALNSLIMTYVNIANSYT